MKLTARDQLIQMPKDGENGKRGLRGRIPIIAGSYDSSKTYICDDNSTRVTEDEGVYYILSKNVIYDSSFPAPHINYEQDGDEAFWQPIDWFEFIFTKLVMAEMGRIADACFSGSFMFSSHGKDSETLEDTDEPSRPVDNGGHFIPNLLLNFLEGTAKLAGGNWLIEKTEVVTKIPIRIVWRKIATELANESTAITHALDLRKGMYFNVDVSSNSEYKVRIPPATDYKQQSVIFAAPGPHTRMSGTCRIYFADGSAYKATKNSASGYMSWKQITSYDCPLTYQGEAISTETDTGVWRWVIKETNIY